MAAKRLDNGEPMAKPSVGDSICYRTRSNSVIIQFAIGLLAPLFLPYPKWLYR